MTDTRPIMIDGITFPTDYAPFPALLGEVAVTVKSATTLYALIILPNGTETAVLVSHLHR
jgi:hypothetical protein